MIRKTSLTAAVLLALIGAAQTSLAQSVDLTWNTVDGGGSTSTGAAYQLSGTIGQPDAGTLSGGAYVLSGGFWALPPCAGDLNGDGQISLNDLAILLAHYGATGASPADGDLNGDHAVDLSDLASLLSKYGTTCP